MPPNQRMPGNVMLPDNQQFQSNQPMQGGGAPFTASQPFQDNMQMPGAPFHGWKFKSNFDLMFISFEFTICYSLNEITNFN